VTASSCVKHDGDAEQLGPFRPRFAIRPAMGREKNCVFAKRMPRCSETVGSDDAVCGPPKRGKMARLFRFTRLGVAWSMGNKEAGGESRFFVFGGRVSRIAAG
jgi:hypothetical protein